MRTRWLVTVTAAETAGYLAPTLAGIFSERAGLSPGSQVLLLSAAGFIEGLALGTGQAHAFPFQVRRVRYALLTAAGAALVWASVMAMMAGWLPTAAVPLLALGAVVAIGGAQWFELRHHCTRAYRWIGWTALAWTLALPLSFAPAPLVDESTPLAVHVVAWTLGGALMAFVMAAITWQGVKRFVGYPYVTASTLLPSGSSRNAAKYVGL
ncbi:MAG TPA: hypothetical protein VIV40_37520 [Kofleriaceae bacterium]